MGAVAPTSLAAREVVVVKGTQTDRDTLGRDAGRMALMAMSVMQTIMSALPRDVQEDIYDGFEENQEDAPEPLTPNYTIRFSPTTMRMDQGPYTWMIVVTDVHVGYFGWDRTTNQGVKDVASIQGLVNLAERVAPFKTVKEGFSKQCEPGGDPVELGSFQARFCSYEHTGSVVARAGSGSGPTGLGTTTKTVGKAWIATGIPGEETIQAFYRNLNERVSGSPGVGSYFAELVASMLDVMEEGIPIVNRVEITQRVAGKELQKNYSTTRVSSVTIETPDDPTIMTEDGIPEDVAFLDMGDLENMASSFAGGGAAAAATGLGAGASEAPSSDSAPTKEGCDCSCEAFSKMQNMSKKERKAMESSPDGMAMAMCMGQCMPKWMACAQQ